jgi:hypothetical protein
MLLWSIHYKLQNYKSRFNVIHFNIILPSTPVHS